MSIKNKINATPDIAVFVRNHAKYLQSAAERNALQPTQFTTFRAAKEWNNAHYALQKHKTLTCYLAPIGGKNIVEYKALIHHIQLKPHIDDPETRKWLDFSLPTTRDEGLWNNSVHTLYTITHCERLPVPISMTELVKISDDKPISENYGYSYSLVYNHTPAVPESIVISPEEVPYESNLYEGAARTVSVVSRKRSARARKRCLDHFGYDCSVCGFNFEKKYGEIGKGFIHVHHLTSLARANGPQKIDPIDDLRPVCPNCHAMLHSQNPELSVHDLKKKMGK